MVVGLLGNESPDSNRFTLVTPKSENDVRLQATLDNQNPTGLPVGIVSLLIVSSIYAAYCGIKDGEDERESAKHTANKEGRRNVGRI